jgi:Na+/melibiose symporter-like transporter
MKNIRKKVIVMTLVLLTILFVPTVSAAEPNVPGDVSISNLNWAMESKEGEATLYLWWSTNSVAKDVSGLEVNITINNQYIGTTLANDHLALGDAWAYDEWAAMFPDSGSYDVKVEFINVVEPTDVANSANNKAEKTVSVGEGFLSDVKNGIYSFESMVDDAVDATGFEILQDLPVIPIIAGIVVAIIAFVIYRRYKKKKKKKKAIQHVVSRSQAPVNYGSYNSTNYPPYGNEPPKYPPGY